ASDGAGWAVTGASCITPPPTTPAAEEVFGKSRGLISEGSSFMAEFHLPCTYRRTWPQRSLRGAVPIPMSAQRRASFRRMPRLHVCSQLTAVITIAAETRHLHPTRPPCRGTCLPDSALPLASSSPALRPGSRES